MINQTINAATSPKMLERAPASIIGSDFDDLCWFFRTGGTDVFAASTSGAQWERASMFTRSWRACERCGGDTALGKPGLGFVPSKTVGRVPTSHEAELLRLLDLYVDVLPPAADKVCPNCGGRGFLIDQSGPRGEGAVTARPTGSSVKSNLGGSVMLDDTSVARLGRVSALLGEVRDMSPSAVAVIAAFYGPEWTHVSDAEDVEAQARLPARQRRIANGRRRDGICGMFGVWPLTPAGKTLSRRSPKLHPLAALANQSAAERERPERKRGDLLRAAEEQATVLYVEACRIWNYCSARRRRLKAPRLQLVPSEVVL